MEKVKSPWGRLLIHLALLIFALYSLIPFYWTAMQSFKKLRDANARPPQFWFTPTWENYQELWLRSAPANGATLAYGLLLAVVLLVALLLFAEYLPWPKPLTYGLRRVIIPIVWPGIISTALFSLLLACAASIALPQ